jgi:hypothetical protein
MGLPLAVAVKTAKDSKEKDEFNKRQAGWAGRKAGQNQSNISRNPQE